MSGLGVGTAPSSGLGGGAASSGSSGLGGSGVGTGAGKGLSGGLAPGLDAFIPKKYTDFQYWREQIRQQAAAGGALFDQAKRASEGAFDAARDFIQSDSPFFREQPASSPPITAPPVDPPFEGGQMPGVAYRVRVRCLQRYSNYFQPPFYDAVVEYEFDYVPSPVRPYVGREPGFTFGGNFTPSIMGDRYFLISSQVPGNNWMGYTYNEVISNNIIWARRMDGLPDTGGSIGGGAASTGAPGGFGGAIGGGILGNGSGEMGRSGGGLAAPGAGLGGSAAPGAGGLAAPGSLGGNNTGSGVGSGLGSGLGAGAGAGADTGAGSFAPPGAAPGTLAPPGTAANPGGGSLAKPGDTTIVLPGVDVVDAEFVPADGSKPGGDRKNQKEPMPFPLPIPLPPCLPTLGQCQSTCTSEKPDIEIEEPISGVFTAYNECGDEEEPFEFGWTGTGFFGVESAFGALNSRLMMLEELICSKECVTAIPSWWEYVKAGDCPQYQLLMRSHEKQGKNYKYRYFYIPNPIADPGDDNYPGWTMGSVSVKARFPDNRSILVYASTEIEGKRVINALASKTNYPQPYDISVTYTTRDIESIDYIPWLVRYKLPSDGFREWQFEVKLSRDSGEGGFPSP